MSEQKELRESDPRDYGIAYGEMNDILSTARKTYGNKNQILVCMEELNELACVLAKYPRYEDEDEAVKTLYNKALDEVADVYTILEHVKAIFSISEEKVWERRCAKAARLKRWLDHSSSMTETTRDRAVALCSGCIHNIDPTEKTYNEKCVHCLKAQSTEGIAPYKQTISK